MLREGLSGIMLYILLNSLVLLQVKTHILNTFFILGFSREDFIPIGFYSSGFFPWIVWAYHS